MSVHDVLRRVLAYRLEHVVITGGEPMLYSELIPLCESLSDHGCHITVETAGTLYLPLHCDLMSISPKLSNSTPRGAEHAALAPAARAYPARTGRHSPADRRARLPDQVRRRRPARPGGGRSSISTNSRRSTGTA